MVLTRCVTAPDADTIIGLLDDPQAQATISPYLDKAQDLALCIEMNSVEMSYAEDGRNTRVFDDLWRQWAYGTNTARV